MVRQRRAVDPVVKPHEAAFMAKAEPYEARILDDDSLEALQFGAIGDPLSGLGNRPAPSGSADTRWSFALDREG